MINICPPSGRRCFPPPTPALLNEIYLSVTDSALCWVVVGGGAAAGGRCYCNLVILADPTPCHSNSLTALEGDWEK